jgi:hypothetical protein
MIEFKSWDYEIQMVCGKKNEISDKNIWKSHFFVVYLYRI